MTLTFISLATCMDERDIEAATDHPAVTSVSVDRGPDGLCRPCVEIDPVVAAMLDRAGLENGSRRDDMDRIAKGWRPS